MKLWALRLVLFVVALCAPAVLGPGLRAWAGLRNASLGVPRVVLIVGRLERWLVEQGVLRSREPGENPPERRSGTARLPRNRGSDRGA
jgi:hypothetical protein